MGVHTDSRAPARQAVGGNGSGETTTGLLAVADPTAVFRGTGGNGAGGNGNGNGDGVAPRRRQSRPRQDGVIVPLRVPLGTRL
ncbi:MAG TPA: hypothetical protein VFM27_03395, partial [Acidimicrobiales bacterium]|nr:hypothetical protein [Acidimicrobiales bacterium]